MSRADDFAARAYLQAKLEAEIQRRDVAQAEARQAKGDAAAKHTAAAAKAEQEINRLRTAIYRLEAKMAAEDGAPVEEP